MLKKAAIFGLAGVMAVAAGCGSNKDAGNANSNEAKIALLTTTTGGAAAYGESIKAGAELAVSEINADANPRHAGYSRSYSRDQHPYRYHRTVRAEG